MAEGYRVRFFNAGGLLPELDELVVRLESAMTRTLARLQDLEGALKQERAAREQADARVPALEAELAALRAKR